MRVPHYKTFRFANAQAKIISSMLGIYISAERDKEGYYLSTKYAQGLTTQ